MRELDVPTRRARLLLAALVVSAVGLLAACGDVADSRETGPDPAPDVRLQADADDVGPSRTDVIITATNAGTAHVLAVLGADLEANVGADRNNGPTTRATVTDGKGREVSANVREPKTLTWVPERIRAGATLTWQIAVRCTDQNPTTVTARLEQTTVGSVRESDFEPLTERVTFSCPPPRPPGT